MLDCGGDEPPAMHARRARRARVARRDARAASSLRTKRRREGSRETRTTIGDRSQAHTLPWRRAVLTHHGRARRRTRSARRARAARRRSPRASVSSRPPRVDEAHVISDGKKSLRVLYLQSSGQRRKRCGGSGRPVSGAWETRTARTIANSKQARARWVERALDRQERLARGSAGGVGRRRRAGSGGFEGATEDEQKLARARRTHAVRATMKGRTSISVPGSEFHRGRARLWCKRGGIQQAPLCVGVRSNS